MTLRTIIGVTGYAQHGKDTVGQLLVEEYGYTRLAFADGVREAALKLDPITYVSTDPVYAGDVQRLSEEVEAGGWEGAKQNSEVRRILQVLGTDVVRDIDPDAWVKIVERKLDVLGPRMLSIGVAPSVVITDVRFPNEAAAIHKWGGEIWRVERYNPPSSDTSQPIVPGCLFDNGVGTDHPSEAHVMTLPVDHVLRAVSVTELHGAARAIMDGDSEE